MNSHTHRQDRWLRIFRQQELRLRPFEAEAAQRLADRLVSFFEGLPADRKRLGQGFAHADLLRTLARKDECNHARF